MRIGLIPQVGGGGPASFQSRLRMEFLRQNIETTFDIRSRPLDAILVFAGTRNLQTLFRCKTERIPIVQRLDGINWLHRRQHYPIGYRIRAEMRQTLVRWIRYAFADRVIYQSRFIQEWWEKWYGVANARSHVIRNGVPLGDFTMHAKPPDGTILVVEGNLHFNLPTVATILALEERLAGSQTLTKMELLGELDPDWKKILSNRSESMIALGMIPREEVRAKMRTASLMLSMEINPPCPNAVIESLAAGLPVIGWNTGSLRELIGKGGKVVTYQGDPWKLEVPLNLPAMWDAAMDVVQNWEQMSAEARHQAELHFDIRETAKQYCEVLVG